MNILTDPNSFEEFHFRICHLFYFQTYLKSGVSSLPLFLHHTLYLTGHWWIISNLYIFIDMTTFEGTDFTQSGIIFSNVLHNNIHSWFSSIFDDYFPFLLWQLFLRPIYLSTQELLIRGFVCSISSPRCKSIIFIKITVKPRF